MQINSSDWETSEHEPGSSSEFTVSSSVSGVQFLRPASCQRCVYSCGRAAVRLKDFGSLPAVCFGPSSFFYVSLSCCETCQNLLTSQSPYLLLADGVLWMSTSNARTVYPANILIKTVSDLDDYRLFWRPLSRSLWGLLWSFSLSCLGVFSRVETWTFDIVNSSCRTARENRTQPS